jgi:hypothetical protein
LLSLDVGIVMVRRGVVSICRRIQTPIRRTLAETVAAGCWRPVALGPSAAPASLPGAR